MSSLSAKVAGKVLLAVVLTMLPAAAAMATAACPDFLKPVIHVTKSYSIYGDVLAGRTIGYGAMMLRAFLLVSLIWYGVMMIFSVGTAWAQPQNLMQKLFWWGAIFALFHYYGPIYHMVYSSFRDLGNALMGAQGGSTISSGICTIYTSTTQWTHSVIVATATPFHSFWSFFDASGAAIWNWFVSRLMVFSVLLTMLLLVGLYIFWLIIPTLLLVLGFGLGPLAVPFLMFKFTREIFFDGWFGFMVTALMYLIMGPAIIGLVSAASSSLVAGMLTNGKQGAVGYGAFLSIEIILFASLWMMWKLPDKVRMLASGAFHPGIGVTPTGAIASAMKSGSGGNK